MAWIKFYQGQSAVNTKFLVSASVHGREDHCQVLFKDCNGDKYSSKYCTSFSEAEALIRNFLVEAVEDEDEDDVLRWRREAKPAG